MKRIDTFKHHIKAASEALDGIDILYAADELEDAFFAGVGAFSQGHVEEGELFTIFRHFIKQLNRDEA